VHYGISQTLPLKVANILWQETTILVFNCEVEYALAWYETEVFKMVLLVVSVIIIIWTGQAWVAGLVAALDVGIVAVILYLLETILIKLVIQYAFDYLAEEVGGEWAMVIAVASAIAAAWYGDTSGAIEVGAIGSAAGSGAAAQAVTMTLADTLMMSASMMLTSAQQAFKTETEEMLEEIKQLEERQEEELDMLTQIRKDLGLDSYNKFGVEIAKIIRNRPLIIQEEPSAFYDRTIHSGNIGTLTFDMLHGYYDLGLQLPKNTDINS
jgi:hypothetical protein